MEKDLLLFYLIGIFAVIFFSASVFYFTYKGRIKFSNSLLVALIIFSFYLPIAQLLKYYSLHFYVDFAAWGEILNNIIKTGIPISSIQGFFSGHGPEYHWFSAHFTPLIYLLAAPFKFLPYSETIIILNGLLMLSSVIPLYKLAVHLGGNKRSGLFIATIFLWYPTFQYVTLYEFEMLRFSIPILLWMLYFFEARRVILSLIFMVLAILVREEIGLTVAMFGLYAWFFEKRRREGAAAIVLGLGGFMLITSAIMPALRGGEYTHVAAGVFSQFGSTPLEIVRGVVAHPLLAAQTVFNPVKLANLFMLGLPLLFISVAAPAVLIGAVANIGTGLLSDSLVHSSYMLYYIAPSVPFIFYAFLKAWPKVVQWLPSPSPQSPPIKGGEVKKDPSPLMGEVRRGWNETALMCAVLAGVLLSNIFFGPSPISLQFWFKNIRPAPFRTQDFHWSVYRVTDHHRKVNEFVRQIPDEAIVSAPQFLHPRLYKKRGIMVFPALQSKDGQWQAQYVLLDATNNGLKSQSPGYITEEEMAVVRGSDEWERMAEWDGYELFRSFKH